MEMKLAITEGSMRGPTNRVATLVPRHGSQHLAAGSLCVVGRFAAAG
ncbi:hypothetical protein BJY21_003596 [Kineosphaera limosa]|nr:hypothetical protein [Kineosphaera limosa]